MRRGLVFICVGIALATVPASGRHTTAGCGTTGTTPAEVMFLHRQAQRARTARPAARAAAAASTNRDIGNVAIIEDRDGVVEKLNQFKLDAKTVTLTPVAGPITRYRFQISGLGYEDSAAAQGSPVVGIGDDDSRQYSLPFAFPFYGAAYSQVFLNSDGNLTFAAAESASTGRTLGRMTGGPPRISALFDDLDPSQPGGGVRYFFDAKHAVFTWVNVPEFSDYGVGRRQTFQVRLYADGSIQFSYAGANPDSAVVGIAPGSAQPGTSVVSFYNDVSLEYAAAVAERFGNTLEVDIVTVAQKFYETHEDAYDYLVIYNNMDVVAMTGAVAYEATVRSNATGYGVPTGDYGAQYGSAARLRSVLNMGRLRDYPTNPNGSVPIRAASQDTPLTVLGHESGHLFLAFASIPSPTDPFAKPMIGFGGSHWSFLFNSEASLDEGEQITESSPGHFLTTAVTQGYAPLDRYLMGFAPPSDVPDTFVVLNASASAVSHPVQGYAFTGTRLNISANDVIKAMGRRTPDYTVAQRRFRFGFVLVVPQGTQDSALADSVQQVETYRQQYVAAYTKYSAGLATAETTLNRSLRLSLFPAAGVPAGSNTTATISVQTAPSKSLAVTLAGPGGFAQVPPVVTIPAGSTTATFTVAGVKSGVEELTATPADSTYEIAFARVQVADASQLALQAVSGDNQVPTNGGPLPAPVVVRLTDVNGLPYPGARIQAVAIGGSVAPLIAMADAAGNASFQWTPAGGAASQLNFYLAGTPEVTLTLRSGTAVPVISAVVNAASFVPNVAPGSLATLFGKNLSGAAVLLNGTDVQPFYTSDTQSNFYVPPDIEVGSGVVTVTTTAGVQASSKINLVALQPGIFSGAVVHAGTLVSALTTPAAPGEFIEIYCTGLGPTRELRGLSLTTVVPTVYLGATAVTPSYSGLAPGFPGLYQVNVQIPPGLPSGTLALSMASGNAYSNEVKIAVQ